MMEMFLFHLYGISLIVCIGSVSGLMSRQPTARVYEEFEDKIMSKLSRKILYVKSLVYCHTQCLEDEECLSFFYRRGNKTCQTHGVAFFNPDDGNFSPGTKYYRTTHGSCSSSLGYFYNRALKFCYKLHYTATMAYSSSRQVCKNEGGDLITIDTKEQLDHLSQTISASTFPLPIFRLGARGGVVANDWRWMDGKNITQGLWCPGEPNRESGFAENAFVSVKSDGSGCMANFPEGLVISFFCELKV